MNGIDSGWALLSRPLLKLFHWINRNSRNGSARNIAAHYDLGNELYELMLDDTMAYSCAIFPHPEASLAEGSMAKFDAACRKLQLVPEDHLLEIGTAGAASRFTPRSVRLPRNHHDDLARAV